MTDVELTYLDEGYNDDDDIDVVNLDPSGTHLTSLTFKNVENGLVDLLVGRFKEVRNSSRRVAAHAQRTAKRRQDKIANAAMRLRLNSIWFTSTNERIEVKKMTPRHASRSLNLLTNDFGRWIGDRDLTYEDLGLPFALKDAPLVEALTKQSKVRETKRHRALDEVADTVYRAAVAGGRLRMWVTIEEFNNSHSPSGRS